MKLVLAIVNNDDSAIVSSALTHEGFFVTKLSTTGGFLMVGNTTLLIGTEDDKVDDIYEYFKDSETDDLDTAIEELGDEYAEEEIRLVRIKFISEAGN